MAQRFVPPSINRARRTLAAAGRNPFLTNPWVWGRPGNTTRTGRPTPPAQPPPAAAATDPVAAPPPAPPPDPVSYGQQANIDQLTAQRAGLSGVYNPQREALYIEGARGLLDQGYFDTAQAAANPADAASGAVTYRLVVGADGRLYRQAFQQTATAFNARGAFDSSERLRTQADQRRDLTNARDAILRSLAGQQDTLTRQQVQDTTNLSGEIARAQGDYADWRAAQPVPPAPPASEAVTPTPPTATRTRQARWRVRPVGFATVKRGGWWYRA